MDFISISIEGTVTSDPIRKGKDYLFDLQNKRDKYCTDFSVFVRNDERPIDINKGDKVVIANAGFYTKDGVNRIAVIESSHIAVQRIRCNLGMEEVE